MSNMQEIFKEHLPVTEEDVRNAVRTIVAGSNQGLYKEGGLNGILLVFDGDAVFPGDPEYANSVTTTMACKGALTAYTLKLLADKLGPLAAIVLAPILFGESTNE